MAERHSITVSNETGFPQDYYVIPAGLLISGGVSGTAKLNVVSKAFAGPGQLVQFSFYDKYWAVSGTYRNDKLAVNKAIPITLGSQGQMGSTVALSVINREVPDINEQSPGQGKIRNFQLSSKSKSGHEFTFQDAVEKGFFVGIATGGDEESAARSVLGTFMPGPNSKYQVMSPDIYYIATGDELKHGQVVRIEDLQNTIAVSFAARGTNDVRLVHDDYNNFSFKT